MSAKAPALLALEDGTVLHGRAFGAPATRVGEAVFNTSMSGYQEILTDPSYLGQIVTMTAPQIGNYGVNPDDCESDGPKPEGFVCRDLSPMASNWRSQTTLDAWLAENGVPGLEGIDTRFLTKRLRVAGAMKACLSTENITADEAVDRARQWIGLQGTDYVARATCQNVYAWESTGQSAEPFTVPGTILAAARSFERRYRVAAFDLGAKWNIFRKLSFHGFDVTVVPASTSFEAVREMGVDCVFLSNGPGDPAAVGYVHQTVARLIEHFPTFGICMGNQMLTHALGAQTFKLKFGHRGANQPVINLETGRVAITSQNHGFAARREDLENRGAIVTEINLNDQTVEGLRHKDLPVFSVQYHPEASPGPHDAEPLFERFYDLVDSTLNS